MFRKPYAIPCKVCSLFLSLVASIVIIGLEASIVHAKEIDESGDQIYDLTLSRSVFSKDDKGHPIAYIPLVGNPAKLVIADLQTRKTKKEIPIPGAKGAWAITQSTDGKVWIGTYTNGHVYRYDPQTDVLTDMGNSPAKSTVLYGLIPGKNGTVYGGSYGEAKVFAYTKQGNSYDLGSMFPDMYARDLALDSTNHTLYVGIGAIQANVVRYNLKTGEKKPILPLEYQSNTFADHLSFVANRLMVKLDPAMQEVILDPNTGKPQPVIDGISKKRYDSFPIGSQGVSPLAPDGKSVYFSHQFQLYCLDLLTNTYIPVPGASLANNVISWGWVTFSEPDFPGKTLVGLVGNYDGRAFRYNPITGAHEEFMLPLPPQPLDLYHITASDDGKVYTSAYINGSLGIFDTKTGTRKQFPSLGQVEGWTWHRRKLYIGTYPAGKVIVYDPKQAWKTKTNPKVLFSLKEEEQNRPLSLVTYGSNLYVASRPGYGKWGGALTIYNLKDGGKPVVLRNIVVNQTVSTLTVTNKILWAGTSIDGGDATKPKASAAVLFAFDPVKQKKIAEYSPLVQGVPLRISGLITGPDGMLWGIADGILFQFDPQKKRAIRQTKLVQNGETAGTSLVFHPNGHLYITVAGRLFEVDPITWKQRQIRYKTNLYRLALVGQDLYMKAGPHVHIGTQLVKYRPK
jgi:streptogramin lyase